MPQLVALDMPVGSRFVEVVREAWEQGNAVAPLDQRLSPRAKERLIEAIRPTRLATESNERALPNGVPVETGDALVVTTSGSLGVPKAVIHTHESIRAALLAAAERLALHGTEHWLLCIPAAHVGGFLLVARHLIDGNPLTVQDRFDPAGVMSAARAGATHVSLVATALQRIDPALFTRILLGGASAPPSLPLNVTVTYGMTETMGGCVYDGRALSGVDIVLRDDEILIKGPMLMRSYREGPDHLTPDGYFPTGDLGSWIDRDLLAVHGRRGDLIISGGEKIWPTAVESVLASHPHVRECAVRGVEDAHWGQRVVAWIVVGEASPTLEEIRAWVKESLPPYCAPREVRIVEALPRTALGKIDGVALRALN
jgi:O-succinylbenzoic acid--CoA ligase